MFNVLIVLLSSYPLCWVRCTFGESLCYRLSYEMSTKISSSPLAGGIKKVKILFFLIFKIDPQIYLKLSLQSWEISLGYLTSRVHSYIRKQFPRSTRKRVHLYKTVKSVDHKCVIQYFWTSKTYINWKTVHAYSLSSHLVTWNKRSTPWRGP